MRTALLLLLAPTAMSFGGPLREIKDPSTFSALAFVPPGAEGPMPLLLYLHGAGESGTSVRDLISEGATGTPPVELEHKRALPILHKFVTVAPQTSHGWSADEVGKFTDWLVGSAATIGLPPLDTKRLYVTGHSMGGGGALLAASTRKFAACVPVAPSGSARPAELKKIPIWAFHGKNDVIVPSSISERLIQKLRQLGANESEAKLTLYDAAPPPKGWPDYDGHGSPVPAYATPELWRWLLEQHL